MAFRAELSRSAPQIVTQMRAPQKGTDLTAGALFFDSESRANQQGAEGEESQQAARDLDMQVCWPPTLNSHVDALTAPLKHTHVAGATLQSDQFPSEW
tara:strand:- start:1647 stop:1940 length:294 start_codon:yes stop_codon:yes gene_type:complete